MTDGACPCVSAGGAHFKGMFCEVKLLLLIYMMKILFAIVSHRAFCTSSLGGLLNIKDRILDFKVSSLS